MINANWKNVYQIKSQIHYSLVNDLRVLTQKKKRCFIICEKWQYKLKRCFIICGKWQCKLKSYFSEQIIILFEKVTIHTNRNIKRCYTGKYLDTQKIGTISENYSTWIPTAVRIFPWSLCVLVVVCQSVRQSPPNITTILYDN